MNDRDPNFADKAVAIIELLLNPYCTRAIGTPRVRVRAQWHRRLAGWLPGQRRPGVRHGPPQAPLTRVLRAAGLARRANPSRQAHPSDSGPGQLPPIRSSGEVVGLPPAAHVRVPLLASACVLPEFIEVWFSVLSRKCHKRADLADAAIATEQIEVHDHAHHPSGTPLRVKKKGRALLQAGGRPRSRRVQSCNLQHNKHRQL